MNKNSIKGFTFTFYNERGCDGPIKGFDDRPVSLKCICDEHDCWVDEEDDDWRMIYALTDEGWHLVARLDCRKFVAENRSSDLEVRTFFEAYEADDEEMLTAVATLHKCGWGIPADWDKAMLAIACKALNKSEAAKAIGMTPQRLNNCLDASRCEKLNIKEMCGLLSYLDKVGNQLRSITSRLHFD